MILRPRKNVWRLERAARAAVLVDGANYFLAVRQALLNARRRVFIVGWDFHSQTRLVGESGEADDGYPPMFGEFLTALARDRPSLDISLLLWDYAMLYAGQRELFPTYTFRWNMPSQVSFCLDDAVPIGSSQHQKLIVVDDAVAFSGGLDVTIRRWDTTVHALANPNRVDPAGVPYPPFHDVQMLVDGDAAAALARLVRNQWSMAACEDPGPVAPHGDPWPDSVIPDFTGVKVGIARTCPHYDNQGEVREVEALYRDTIAAAESSIYIENQFVTCNRIAQLLAQRLKDRPDLHALIVVPSSRETWLEEQSMRYGRIRFKQTLQQAGVADRVHLVAPMVVDGDSSVATMVHSKVMIVDDRLLRVGSANLNNRSMAIDTECDLVIEARTPAERQTIVGIRNRLLADHCGVAAADVETALVRTPSLLAVAESLSGRGHQLRPMNDEVDGFDALSPYLQEVADPERPIGAEEFVTRMLGGYVQPRHASTVVKLLGAAMVVLLLALIWRLTPLATWADPDTVRGVLGSFANSSWGPVAVIAAFVVGGLVLFPVTILIAATAAAFGPLLGFVLAATGTMLSAVTTYLIGARLGKDSLREVLGPRLNRVREQVRRRGVLAVASVRLVPVAPFTVVNLAAGASDIRFTDFVIGTIVGMLPGLTVMALLGHQVSQFLIHPSALQLATFAGAVLVWIAVSIGIQVLASRFEDTT
ncbi:MAG: phospholipase [Rhizobiales bacterium]|nr:phospholipase [Hyphomicrobiales bacterium]